MEIIPAIDLREGACARIFSDVSPAEIYSDDPLEQAVIFKHLGVKSVHITDLDGSFCGHLCNLRVIQEMLELSGLAIELVGGIRSMENIDTLIDLGVSRVVVGVQVLRDKELTKKAFEKYGEKILPGIDARDGMVAIEGFETSLGKTAAMVLKEIKAMGINKIIYTDLRRYGSMKGPNFQGIEEMVETSGMEIVVAGGISDYQALRRLKDIGVAGAVIGKAIYSGNIASLISNYRIISNSPSNKTRTILVLLYREKLLWLFVRLLVCKWWCCLVTIYRFCLNYLWPSGV